jgi:glycerol-3-phosphate acyltransferase PlsY
MSTQQALILVVAAVAGYLIGAIPVGIIVARLSGGPDPRTIGSGRTGGTNALRALGRKWAAIVVLGDVAKGAVPVLIAAWISGWDPWPMAIAALAAVLGAIRSVYIRFHGGRGVGAGVGTLLVMAPLAALVTAPVFFGAVIVTRYVSLGSLLGAAAICPATLLTVWLTQGSVPPPYWLYATVGPALIWIAHWDNVQRLLRGEERRLDVGLLTGRSRRR